MVSPKPTRATSQWARPRRRVDIHVPPTTIILRRAHKLATMSQFKLRPLSKTKSLHTNDTIHKSIRLCPLLIEIADTPHFQRLRKLKQLGTSEYTYVNANHTRFEHSLGVAHLAKSLLLRIRQEQPLLGISDKDVKCVEIAGLCHDLGHGPFSHVYDGEFRRQLSKATANQSWMGQRFDVSIYEDLPKLPVGWAHEDDSLMMIDDMLQYLGMEVDEDNLDAPLKQIGDGIDVHQFGIVDSTTGKFDIITSQDIIFIKECIAGGPLPQKGMSIDALKMCNEHVEYVGRQVNKEFLYDIVSNRHSGFDFDKGDYLARDKFYCFGFKGFEQCVLDRLLQNACVAWASCANPRKCFRCKHNKDVDGEAIAGKHLTICWPQKIMPTVREFFRERFLHHMNIYRHPTTQACSFMICDILLLADQFLKLSTESELQNETDNTDIMYLPISRANINPKSYWKLDDSVFDLIHKSTDPNLRPARQLINRMKSRKLYKLCGEHDIGEEMWETVLWDMKEDDIIKDMLRLNDGCVPIEKHYVIVEKRGIHHGMGRVDPVSCVRFVKGESDLNKVSHELPTAVKLQTHACLTPQSFLMQTVRVYCRVDNDSVTKQINRCFHKLIESLQVQANDKEIASFDSVEQEPENIASAFAIEDDGEVNLRNDVNILTQSPILSSSDQSTMPISKRINPQSLFNKAVKRKLEHVQVIKSTEL